MKTFCLAFATLISSFGFSQSAVKNDSLKSQIFSLSPISKKVQQVNGLVFGVGHCENKFVAIQTINGLNLEANPAPAAGAIIGMLVLIHLPELIKNHNAQNKPDSVRYKIQNYNCLSKIKLNGINISSGCFFTNVSMNGLNISAGNKFDNFNGISIAPLGTISDNFNGFSVGIINCSNNLKGFSVGVLNQSYCLNGLQVGIVNKANFSKGVQIGIFNKSINNGFQLGFWNKNKNRSLPFINF